MPKAFCKILEEAQEITKLAKAHQVELVIHENFRFQPWYRVLKAEIETGQLGQLYQFRFDLRPGDGRGADAYLNRQPYFQKMDRFLVHETAVHFLDLFTFLFGRPHAVYADVRRLNPAIAGEDAALIIFKYKTGMRAIFDGNRLACHRADNHRLTMGEALFETQTASFFWMGLVRFTNVFISKLIARLFYLPIRVMNLVVIASLILFIMRFRPGRRDKSLKTKHRTIYLS